MQRFIASCLNDACRHTALIEVWSYPAETEIPYFKSRVVCAKYGSRGNEIDLRPNWNEQPPSESLTGKVVALNAPLARRYHPQGAEYLGTVEAATEKEAIEKAAERFEIPPDRRNRSAVQKMTKNKD